MNILGLSGAVGHDASAALFVDGQLVAAVEEERFLRDKHAKGKFPLESSRYCLEFAGLQPDDIDLVAFPYAPISLLSPARWHLTHARIDCVDSQNKSRRALMAATGSVRWTRYQVRDGGNQGGFLIFSCYEYYITNAGFTGVGADLIRDWFLFFLLM